MPEAIQIRARSYSTKRLEFEYHDMSKLLDIKSTPQMVDDAALTGAQNVYGNDDGGITLRKGDAAIGALTAGVSPTLGLERFYQTVVNGVNQNPISKLTLQMVAGTLYDANTKLQLTPLQALGAAAKPWSTQRFYDGQHLQSPPGTPTAILLAGGTLAVQSFTYAVTVTNGTGQTIGSYTVTIVTTAGNQKVQVSWGPAIPGATGYKVYRNSGAGLKLMSDGTIGVGSTVTYTDTGAGTEGVAIPITNTAGAAPSDVLVICTGSGGPYIWDGYQLTVPADYSNNVQSARWVKECNGILWFGEYPNNPSQVTGGLVGAPETIPGFLQFNTVSKVTGIATVTNSGITGLAVGMQVGLKIIYGNYPGNVQAQDVKSPDGVIAGRSMITYNGVLYYTGAFARYMYDGVNPPVPISRNIEPWVLNDPRFAGPFDLPMSGDKTLEWAIAYNNRIYFFYDTGNVGHCNCGVVWDLNRQGWTTYVGSNLNCGALINAPGDPATPWSFMVGDSVNSQVYSFDVYNGTGDNVDDHGTAISGYAQSKYFKLGKSGARKRIFRVYYELFTEKFGGTGVVSTDYGTSANSQIIVGIQSGGAKWDVAKWDQSTWQSGVLNASNTRVDFNLDCEAAAFGIQTNDKNPPWIFAGCSVEYVMEPKR